MCWATHSCTPSGYSFSTRFVCSPLRNSSSCCLLSLDGWCSQKRFEGCGGRKKTNSASARLSLGLFAVGSGLDTCLCRSFSPLLPQSLFGQQQETRYHDITHPRPGLFTCGGYHCESSTIQRQTNRFSPIHVSRLCFCLVIPSQQLSLLALSSYRGGGGILSVGHIQYVQETRGQ